MEPNGVFLLFLRGADFLAEPDQERDAKTNRHANRHANQTPEIQIGIGHKATLNLSGDGRL
jgi:hypothetical protein